MSSSNGGGFTFRQRAGRLNWISISSLDINDIVINVNIHELQQVLDSVTFSEVVVDDIKNNTIDSVNKLIHTMQYIIEYLLNHQENQFALINKLNHKVTQLKKSREQYYQQNLTFREDIKTYQRQLHLLRKGINHTDQPLQPYARLIGQQPTDDRNHRYNNYNDQIVKTILDHERDVRKNMMELLDDQRREFAREMANIVDILRKHNNTSSSTPVYVASDGNTAMNTGLLMPNMQIQIEKSLQNALETYKENIEKLQKPIQKQEQSDSNTVRDILKQAALEELDRQLREKSQDLKDRENALKVREDTLAKKESLRRIEDSTAKWQNITIHDQVIKRQLGSRLMRSSLFGAFRRYVNRCFRKWHYYVLDEKDKERHEKHGKMLLFANEKKTEYQKHLEKQLNEEKDKYLSLYGQFISLKSEFDMHEQQYQRMRAEASEKQELAEKLEDQLKNEKEKFMILNTKYNAAQTNFNKELQELTDRLLLLESGKSTAQDSSIMTSVDLSFRKKPKKSWSALTHLSPEYFRADLDEEGLLKFAESKITNHYEKPNIHNVAKSLLAKQIAQNISEKIDVHGN